MKEVRFSAIGTGGIFNTIQRFIKWNKRARLTCVVDTNEEVAQKWGRKLDVPYCCSCDDMFDEHGDNVDAVYIATPHFTHKSMMEDAIANGMHIFVEKPATTSLKDTIEIMESAEIAEVNIGVDFQNRYNQVAYSMVQNVRRNCLGRIMYGTVAVPWKRTESYYESGKWRKSWELAGGGTLVTHAIHFIDILIWALGKPVSVSGKYATRKHNIEVDDVGMGIIEFESGAIAQILSSASNNPNRRVKIQIFGEKGNILFNGPFPSFTRYQRVRRRRYPLQERGFISYQKIVDAFVNYLLEDTVFYATIQDSLPISAVIDGIYESSRIGKEVKINTSIF
jgi:predicted dehydrogenase